MGTDYKSAVTTVCVVIALKHAKSSTEESFETTGILELLYGSLKKDGERSQRKGVGVGRLRAV